MFAQTLIIGRNGTGEEAQGFGGISGAPFLAGFFLFDADCSVRYCLK